MRIPAYSPYGAASDSRGFTLVELMVAMVAAIIFIGATVAIVGHTSRIYRAQEQVSDVQQDARAALDLLQRDMRLAGYHPFLDSAAAGAQINTATPTRFGFTMDLNNSDAIEPNSGEDYLYYYDTTDNSLKRQIDPVSGSGATETIIDNVSTLSFTYFDADGNATTDTNTMVRVQVNLSVQGPKHGTVTRTLTANFNFRNRRFT